MAKKQDKATARKSRMRKAVGAPEVVPEVEVEEKTDPGVVLEPPAEAGDVQQWSPQEDAELRELAAQADALVGENGQPVPVETIEELADKLGMKPEVLKPMLLALMRNRNLTFEAAAELVLRDKSILFSPDAQPAGRE